MTEQEFPKVSIIVAAMNSQDTIQECLEALLGQDYPAGFIEVIVMDGGSRDKTVQIAKECPIKVLSIPLNAPAAYNYAFKIASHPILGFVDADAKVEREWLRKLVPHLADPNMAGVSGSIDTWNTQNLWARSIGYEIRSRYQRIGKATCRIATMNLLLKKAVIEEVGGWDENLPSQYDTDLGYRISLKGHRIAYEPSAVCYHFNRPTLHAYYRQQLQYGKNTIKLYFKHGMLARGDEITDVGMNIQPILLLAIFVAAVIGILGLLRPLWYIAGLTVAAIFFYYVYCAVKVAVKFNDQSSLRLIVLYYVRSFAWFIGAVITTLKFLTDRER